jgi:hypothetical protein
VLVEVDFEGLGRPLVLADRDLQGAFGGGAGVASTLGGADEDSSVNEELAGALDLQGAAAQGLGQHAEVTPALANRSLSEASEIEAEEVIASFQRLAFAAGLVGVADLDGDLITVLVHDGADPHDVATGDPFAILAQDVLAMIIFEDRVGRDDQSSIPIVDVVLLAGFTEILGDVFQEAAEGAALLEVALDDTSGKSLAVEAEPPGDLARRLLDGVGELAELEG